MQLIKSEFVEDIICTDVTAQEVPDITKSIFPQIITFIKELNKKRNTFCVGLAAPQINDFRKYFVRYYPENKLFLVFFNCWYINDHSSKTQSKEGCFSYDLGKKVNTVRRWKNIILFHDVWDEKENKFLMKQKLKFSGRESIIMQHETDHLYGITIFNKKK